MTGRGLVEGESEVRKTFLEDVHLTLCDSEDKSERYSQQTDTG